MDQLDEIRLENFVFTFNLLNGAITEIQMDVTNLNYDAMIVDEEDVSQDILDQAYYQVDRMCQDYRNYSVDLSSEGREAT